MRYEEATDLWAWGYHYRGQSGIRIMREECSQDNGRRGKDKLLFQKSQVHKSREKSE